MSVWRLVAALASVLLASPAAAVAASTPAAAAPSAPATPPVAAGTGPAAQATRPPFVPCPVAAVPASTGRPPKPSPPARDPKRPTVGGEGLATAGLTVPAGAPSIPGGITATSWMVADLGSGAVLGGCGPHEQSPPASVQKLLLAATVLPKIDPAQVIEVNQQDLDFERGSSAVGLLLGGHYPVETLWLGLLLNSGNDAANVLARVGGGDAGVAGTLQAMNAEAHHLGALDTHAATPSGLDGPGQFTSAYDLALIARVCFARDDFRRYDAAPTAQIPAQPPKDPRGFQIQNENQLLTHFPGALGGKTGFTDLARHTYVGVAERNGRRLVVTLLGAEAQPLRGWQQGAALLDWGFRVPDGASVGRLVDPGETDRSLDPPARNHAPVPEVRHAQTPLTVRPWSPAAVGSVTAAVAAVPLMVLIANRRRRTSRARVRRR
jgi:serine-type D-Ala-D-Ala carboxypeptidase (penicillin-binding protein 5/6)